MYFTMSKLSAPVSFRFILKSFVVLVLCSKANFLIAQQQRVPICEKYLIIDEKIRKGSGIFENYPGFLQAILYKSSDSVYSFEILYKPAEMILSDKKIVTSAEIDIICQKISNKENTITTTQNEGEVITKQKSGKALLVTTATSLSLLYYGWAIPAALGIEEDRNIIGMYMLTSAAGFFTPLMLYRKEEVSMGMARAYSAGSSLGIFHGFALSTAIYGEDIDERGALGLSVFASVSESFLAFKYAQKHKLSEGNVSMMSMGTSMGMLYGLGFSYLGNADLRGTSAISLIASGAGLYAGNYFTGKQNITVGDVNAISSWSILGAYLALPIINSFHPETSNTNYDKVYISGIMAGSVLGIGYGLHTTRNYDYSKAQGRILGLGPIVGGLLGLGSAYVANAQTSQAYLWSAGVGGVGGMLLTDFIVKNSSDYLEDETSRLSLKLNPMAFSSFQSSKKENHYNTNTGLNSYIFNATYSF